MISKCYQGYKIPGNTLSENEPISYTFRTTYISTIIPETLGPLQFAYRPNRSTDDAISIALHTDLSHLDKRNTYVRMLFIDYSSAFNTIIPTKLITKLRTLGLNTSWTS